MRWQSYSRSVENQPELAHLSLLERFKVRKQVARNTFSHPGFWLIVCVAFAASLAPLFMLDGRLDPSTSSVGFGIQIAWLMAVAAAMSVPMVWLRRRILLRVLKEGQIRPAFCIACGYDLRATRGDTCPECGQHNGPRPPTSNSQS